MSTESNQTLTLPKDNISKTQEVNEPTTIPYQMNVRDKVTKKSRRDGEGPNDISLVLPDLKIYDARPETPAAATAGIVVAWAALWQNGHEGLED